MRILGFVLSLLLIGCGYRPLAHYAKGIFGNSVYVEVSVNPDFPKAGVAAKDILNKAFLSRFHLDVEPKESAQSKIALKLKSITFTSLAQDSEGFTSHYRASVDVEFSYTSIYGESYNIVENGTGDYAATSNMTSIAIEKAQLDAITTAIEQAINAFVSQTFYQGITHLKEKK